MLDIIFTNSTVYRPTTLRPVSRLVYYDVYASLQEEIDASVSEIRYAVHVVHVYSNTI